MNRPRLLAAALASALLLSACAASTGSSPSAPSNPSATPASPSATDGGGGAVGGNPGAGVTPIPLPIGSGGPGAPSIPAAPPTTVTPVANLRNIHDVPAEGVRLDPGPNGHWIATVTWWSGPSPCNELAEVRKVGTETVVLTVREGTADLTVACPALATHKQATVDLGPKPAVGFFVSAYGSDVVVTVSGGPS